MFVLTFQMDNDQFYLGLCEKKTPSFPLKNKDIQANNCYRHIDVHGTLVCSDIDSRFYLSCPQCSSLHFCKDWQDKDLSLKYWVIKHSWSQKRQITSQIFLNYMKSLTVAGGTFRLYRLYLVGSQCNSINLQTSDPASKVLLWVAHGTHTNGILCS